MIAASDWQPGDDGYTPEQQRLIDRAIETALLCNDEYETMLAEMETAEKHGWMAEQVRIDREMMTLRQTITEAFMSDHYAIRDALDVPSE